MNSITDKMHLNNNFDLSKKFNKSFFDSFSLNYPNSNLLSKNFDKLENTA